MRDPGAVVAALHLAQLVGAHLRERLVVLGGVVLDRDLRGHAAHRVHAAAMARLDEELHVGVEERLVHRDLAAVGKDGVRIVRALLDEAEDVVPAAAVEARRVLAQLAQDLVHLEGRGKGLDEHGRLDGPARHPELVLGAQEHVVPEARLEVALELRKVEERAGAARHELLRVVEEVEAEVDERARRDLLRRRRSASPGGASRAGARRARPSSRSGRTSSGPLLEGDRAADGVVEVVLAVDQVRPRGRGRVLEVGHEDRRAGVERVDDHLAVDRARDLDAAVEEEGRHRGALPVAARERSRSRRGSRARRSPSRRGAPGERPASREAPSRAAGRYGRGPQRIRARPSRG